MLAQHWENMNADVTVIQTEHLAAEAAAWLAERCTLRALPVDDAGFEAALAGAHGLLVRTYTAVNAALLDRAPNLRVVGRAGAGCDNIDVAGCRARNVEVVYTPNANTQAVVEYVTGLLLTALRVPVALTEPVDPDRWRQLRAATRHGRQLSELTLGILGLGRIGRRLAEVAGVIGVAGVLYNDLLDIPADQRFGAVPATADRVFGESDIVSIHVDGRAENRHFVAGDLIAAMRPDVILINTSRGYVVDSAALRAFLRGHPGALALLDVHEPEPFGDDYPLLGLPNARLLPHLAASTMRAHLDMSWVVRDVAAVLEGRRPRYPAPG